MGEETGINKNRARSLKAVIRERKAVKCDQLHLGLSTVEQHAPPHVQSTYKAHCSNAAINIILPVRPAGRSVVW